MENYIGVIGTVDKVRGHTAPYFVQHREREKNKPKDTKNLPEIQSKHAFGWHGAIRYIILKPIENLGRSDIFLVNQLSYNICIFHQCISIFNIHVV